ncbi:MULTISPECIES: hypothetical protein [unclassified Streptomyces]|uniref:hypothetical protein n=1 Tax=unclassified Streptomyces TaxID=2593676 RepID=UPI0038186E6B
MTAAGARALAAAAGRAAERRDTGPAPVGPPETGSHFAVLVKPEVMTPAYAEDALATAVDVLTADGVRVLRAAVLPAADFTRRGHLLLHYPRLHRVAADGARALTTAARRALLALLPGADDDDAFGAYEATTREAGLTPEALEERCRSGGIHKLGSGSYASLVEVHGRPVAVLNGFLPALTEGYRAPGAQVGLLECHSPREIAALRGDLLGALHPGAADPASLRGSLGALGGRHGIALSEGRNAVHLSAGHLEAMFQVWRYFGAPDRRGPGDTAFGRTLTAAGVPETALAALAADPDLPADPALPVGTAETLSPHGATEGLARDAVLERVRHWTTRQAGDGRKEKP